MEQMILRLSPDVPVCGTDKNKVPTSKWRRAKCPCPRLQPINLLKIVENLGLSKEKLCYFDISQVCTRAIASQEVRRSIVVHNVHCLCSEEGQSIFLECSAEIHYVFYYRNKREIVAHNASHFSCKATQLERFRFSDWTAVLFCDAWHQQRSLNPNGFFVFWVSSST